MIELRWLSFSGGHKVLQQRTRYLSNRWNELDKREIEHWEWTEWADIPTYLCGIVNGERVVGARL